MSKPKNVEAHEPQVGANDRTFGSYPAIDAKNVGVHTKPAQSERKIRSNATKTTVKRAAKRPVIPMLAFTPGNQDPLILEKLFVRREALLQELELDVQEFATGGSRRHRLLIGPRGIGKSHLLALLNHRITAKATTQEISVHMLPEVLYGIARFADLVDAILDRNPSPRKSNAEAEMELRKTADATPMLILLENLDSILHAIGADGVHHLRSAVEDSRILLITTSPQLFDEARKAKAPLFGFFDAVHLDELSVDDALELMRRVASLREDHELLAFLGTPHARTRAAAVQTLAGGQPRIWMLFTGCLSVQALDELVPLFLESLDNLTPYYVSRVENLSLQLQQIVMMFCRSGSALSNKAIAEGTGIDERRVATAMKDLERKGYVRKPTSILKSVGDERISWWDLREPLMRLSLDAKSSRGKPLRTIIEFLKLWYGMKLYLVPEHEIGEVASTYVNEALIQYDPSSESDEDLLDFATTLSPNDAVVFVKNKQKQSHPNADLALAFETSSAEQKQQQKQLLKTSKRKLQEIVRDPEQIASLGSSLDIAHLLATAINSGLETSSLLRVLHPHQRRLAFGLVLAIPELEHGSKTNDQLEKLVQELEADGYGELVFIFAPVVQWMKSRQLAHLMQLPLEWRQLIEPLLVEWVTNNRVNKTPNKQMAPIEVAVLGKGRIAQPISASRAS